MTNEAKQIVESINRLSDAELIGIQGTISSRLDGTRPSGGFEVDADLIRDVNGGPDNDIDASAPGYWQGLSDEGARRMRARRGHA